MCFLIKNFPIHKTNSAYHDYNTRAKHDLHVDKKNLSLVQKGVQYSSTKIFNALPLDIKNLKSNTSQFKTKLKDYLVENSFYSLDEFFNANNYRPTSS